MACELSLNKDVEIQKHSAHVQNEVYILKNMYFHLYCTFYQII